MAWTDRYVTTGGFSFNGGTNDTSDAWDLVTGWQAVGAGIRLNIKAGTYNINNGGASINSLATQSTANPAWVRGYSSTIGDLVYSRDSNGNLVTTGMPVINLSAQDRFQLNGDGNILESIKVVGSRSNELVLYNSNYGYIYNCSLENQYNLGFSVSSAFASYGWQVQVIGCDILKSGTDTAYGLNLSANNCVVACKICAGPGTGVNIDASCSVVDTIFRDCDVGITCYTANPAHVQLIANCTFYNCTTAAITYPNHVNSASICPAIINCHATDCGQFIKNLYTTAPVANALIGNRTRDNTTPNNNTGDWPVQKAFTTDNGTHTSDYIDAATAKNYTLRPTAVGRAVGMVRNRDIGANQAPSSSNTMF